MYPSVSLPLSNQCRRSSKHKSSDNMKSSWPLSTGRHELQPTSSGLWESDYFMIIQLLWPFFCRGAFALWQWKINDDIGILEWLILCHSSFYAYPCRICSTPLEHSLSLDMLSAFKKEIEKEWEKEREKVLKKKKSRAFHLLLNIVLVQKLKSSFLSFFVMWT